MFGGEDSLESFFDFLDSETYTFKAASVAMRTSRRNLYFKGTMMAKKFPLRGSMERKWKITT